MNPLKLSLPVTVLLLACSASAGEAEPKDKEKGPAGLRHVVIIQDRVPVQFEQAQIGELSEGMRVEMHEARGEWCRVRALFGQAWFEGWIRTAMTAPDSLADVPLKIAPAWPVDVYRDPFDARKDHIVPGQQLLEVRVKFEPTDKSPQRVYFSWADERTADVMLRYGRDGKSLPYGFVRRIAGMTRSTFDREEKKQTLLLTPGEATIETYVFVVPPRAREFDLVLKDVTTRVPLSRR
ncbi:MAG TPA: hypothetical protein PLE19_13550 [Planctomycetota bacterium]|nr:hypothetical protein [Planctomycetota bacterium]HRR80840.1 hypothetical protein [Planctomycetota bacterium]HRT95981.1 hypothetical protein [Planctomycetota bacterium]